MIGHEKLPFSSTRVVICLTETRFSRRSLNRAHRVFRLHKRSVVKQTSWLSWQLSHIELRDWSNCELEKPPSIGGIFDCYNTSHCLFWKWHPIYFVRHIVTGERARLQGNNSHIDYHGGGANFNCLLQSGRIIYTKLKK